MKKSPDHVGFISPGFGITRGYIGWHYIVNSPEGLPTDDAVRPGMYALVDGISSIYVFNNCREWVLHTELTEEYQSYFIA